MVLQEPQMQHFIGKSVAYYATTRFSSPVPLVILAMMHGCSKNSPQYLNNCCQAIFKGIYSPSCAMAWAKRQNMRKLDESHKTA